MRKELLGCSTRLSLYMQKHVINYHWERSVCSDIIKEQTFLFLEVAKMINDRGTKKWTSLMLPEHVEALKKVFAETDYVEKPILDEQQQMEIDMILQLALKDNRTVKIKCYAEYNYRTVEGKPVIIDMLNNCLKLHNDTKIKLDDVMEVNTL